MTNASTHYDETYYSWHQTINEVGGWANLTKFEKYIKPEDNVIDFGCGGGYLLKNLNCKGKVGIEINPAARRQAEEIGVKVYASTNEIKDNWADIIISDNALEHTLNPLQELQALDSKLKKGGRIVFVVPCESISIKYTPDDVNHHLFSWTPLSLGNLFQEAGFEIIESKPYIHKWPRGYTKLFMLKQRWLFELCCRIYGQLERSSFQVRIVARKK
jgi:SAM-dependent methyltransferase